MEAINLPYTSFRENLWQFKKKWHNKPLIINIITKLCLSMQMGRNISCYFKKMKKKLVSSVV